MENRNDSTLFSRLDSVLGRLQSALNGSAGTTASNPADPNGGPTADAENPDTDAPGNLFRCSSCGVVYIAAEKRDCSTCETEVEQVRSTLACQ